MSLPVSQHHGLTLPDGLKEPMPLTDVLNGSTFVSVTGRVYRLFGNEDEMFAMPSIPSLPPIFAASKALAPSLEEILQQIGSLASPTTKDNKHRHSRESGNLDDNHLSLAPCFRRGDEHCSSATESPTLHVFRAWDESAAPRLVKRESSQSNVTLCPERVCPERVSAKGIVGEVAQSPPLPKQKNEKHVPLRVVPEHFDEPFIVPFARPAETSKNVAEETETKSTVLKSAVLKIVTEFIPPVCFTKTFQRCWQRRHKRTLYRRQFTLPVARVVKTEEPPVVDEPVIDEPKLLIDTTTFRWSATLDSLMQTANNQIRMLAEHLAVQLNQGIKAICFKSVFPGDGCSTIMLCAARALTERNYRILLVDTHHRHIDLPKQLNLSGHLDSGNDVISLNEHLGLWVWQESKTAEENMSTLAEVITAQRGEYDLILLDDGSVTESPLTVLVEFWNSVELDGIILVANTKRPTEMPVSHIAGRFRQHHIHLIGIAENYV